MKSKKIIHCLDCGIFPPKVLLCVGFTYEEIMKELNKQKCKEWQLGISEDKVLIESANNLAIQRTVSVGKQKYCLFYIILKHLFTFSDYDMCKLAHEILHICQFMLPDLLNRNQEYEAEAYLHTYLMESSLKILRGK